MLANAEHCSPVSQAIENMGTSLLDIYHSNYTSDKSQILTLWGKKRSSFDSKSTFVATQREFVLSTLPTNKDSEGFEHGGSYYLNQVFHSSHSEYTVDPL